MQGIDIVVCIFIICITIYFLVKRFICNHIFSETRLDGYQYCEKCGKAICNHKWKIKDEITIRFEGVAIGQKYIHRCQNCGEMKETGTGDCK